MFGAVRKGAAPPIGSEMTLHYTPAALPFRMMGGVWDAADGRIADIAAYPRLAAAIGQAYRLGTDTYDTGLQFRFPDGRRLRKGATVSGGGVYVPATYPLDADEAEVLARMATVLGVTGKATTSGQTVSHVLNGATCNLGAINSLETTFDPTVGRKAFEVELTIPTLETTSEAEIYLYVYSKSADVDSFLRSAIASKVSGGNFEFVIDSVAHALTTGDRVGVYLDPTPVTGGWRYYLNGVDVGGVSGDPVYLTDLCIGFRIEVTASSAPDVGDTIAAELITSASDMTGTYPSGTTDIYGNAGGSPTASTIGTRGGSSNSAGHALTESEMPLHHHDLKIGDDANTPVPFGDDRAIATSLQVLPGNVGTAQMYDAGGGAPHAHAIDPEYIEVLRVVRVA